MSLYREDSNSQQKYIQKLQDGVALDKDGKEATTSKLFIIQDTEAEPGVAQGVTDGDRLIIWAD